MVSNLRVTVATRRGGLPATSSFKQQLICITQILDELARDPACIDIRSRLAPIQRTVQQLLQSVDSLLIVAGDADLNESNEGDRAFLAKLDALMSAELENPAFDVRMICVRMRFSAKQMQRKVRMLTGLTPTEYLRQKRLRRAEEILLQGKSVSRAAYAAGFLSQSYFTTCFKTWAGETPRAWQKRMLRPCVVETPELLDRGGALLPEQSVYPVPADRQE